MKILSIIFLVLTTYSYSQISDFNAINFKKADNIAKLNYGNSLENLPVLAYNLTSKLNTDVEKFRAIYFWVSNNITIDANLSDKVLSKRKRFKNDSLNFLKWNDIFQKTIFKKLLKHKRTMCTGYAYLIKELCFFANIQCKIINGYARTASTNTKKLELANHSWNAVKLNNKWYLSDATWSSGYVDNGKFIKNYNNGYFLTDPVLFSKNHYPLKKKWLLDTKLISSSFKVIPIVYSETFKHKVIPVFPEKMYINVYKNDAIKFSLKTLKPINDKKISLIQFIGDKESYFNINNLRIIDNKISFTTTLKHKGFYDIHLKIDNDIVASYTFKVSKQTKTPNQQVLTRRLKTK